MISKERKKYYKSVFTLGAIIGALWCIKLILQSTNSTASIGFIFVPFYGALVGLVVGGCLYVFFTIYDLFKKKIELFSQQIATSIIFVAILTYGGVAYTLKHKALKLASDNLTHKEQLLELYEAFLPWGKEDVLALVASNPNSPNELLEKLSQHSNEYIVSKVAANPNTPLELLEKISDRALSYTTHSGLALNPRLNEKILNRLTSAQRSDFPGDTEYNLYQTFVLAPLARQPELPQIYFDKLAARPQPEYFLATAILNAERVSCDQIKPLLNEKMHTLQNLAYSQFEKHNCN